MSEIILPKDCMSNEFGVFSGLCALIAYCIHPIDSNKRNDMTKVLNIEMLHKFKYDFLDLKKHEKELESPEKAEEFWGGLKSLGTKYNFELPPNIVDITTPRQFAESLKSAIIQLASSSLDLPEDI